MELKNIEAFLRITETKSFSLAAEQLFISQSTISARIKLLEKELNCKLFKRNCGKILEITKEAELVYSLFKEGFMLIESSKDVLAKSKSKEKYKISFTVHMSDPILSEMSKVIYNRLPHYDISLKINGSSKLEKSVRNGEVDLGFAYLESPPQDKRLGYMFLANIETIAVCSPENEILKKGFPINMSDLINEKIIIYSRSLLTCRIMDKFLRKLGFINDFNMTETQNIDVIKKMVKEQHGIAILQKVVVKKELKHKTLVQIQLNPDLPTTPVFVIYNKQIPDDLLETTVNIAKNLFSNDAGL